MKSLSKVVHARSHKLDVSADDLGDLAAPLGFSTGPSSPLIYCQILSDTTTKAEAFMVAPLQEGA